MSVVGDRARKVFPLKGRFETDFMFVTLGVVIGGTIAANAGYRVLRKRPKPVNRDLDVVLESVNRECDDVVSLTFVRADGSDFPEWQAGAHTDVFLPSGRQRQYSLCGDINDRKRWTIAVRRLADGDGGSREIHRLRSGAQLKLRGPRNAFPFIVSDKYLFVAGGIGVTPILPMVREAAARGVDWQFVYAGRSRAALPFLDEIAALDPERVHILTDDVDGVPAAADILAYAPEGAAVYCCGPVPQITALRREFGERPGTFHFERFSALPVVDGKEFEIELVRSGKTLKVPADRTALAVIKESVPNVSYSCQQGFCGVCVQKVVEGPVDHRDKTLTAEQREESMLVCVSRAPEGACVKLDL
ncbi:MAG: PDR/VanB family oxidoreductase [Nocardiaceae bacterium]|nr:PDR/VanB family oxidoreductase [Nocardiaceae bacterium]